LIRTIYIATAILSLVTSSLYAQRDAVPWTQDDVQKILKQRIDIEKQGVGVVVGIVDSNGKQVVAYGSLRKSGSLTKPDGNTNKPDGNTVFEIGSVTKVFTSLLLADMVVRGEVALGDRAAKHLPKTVKMPTRDGREITLLDLATHKSSLPRIPTNLSPKDGMNPYADYSVEQMYAFLSECKLAQNIGESVEYSNLGAGLLGHLLSLRADSNYETLIASRILKPLEMASTSIALTPDMQSRLAPGHDDAGNEVKNWDIPTLAGAGALRSTANDMLRFVEANMGTVKSALTDAMTEQQLTRSKVDSPNLSIALGWFKLAEFGNEVVWHNGQTGGYHSFVGFDKKKGVGVVVLSNSAIDIDDIGRHLIDRRFPLKKPKKNRNEISLDSTVLESYLGDYELAPTFVISITREGKQLMLQATGQPKNAIFAEAEGKFFLKVVDAQISFIKDENGTVTQLILHQGGANQPAKKRQ
jgi:serine-type D-Ala-D-Ala carboxypeptidase/endopeptidase